MPPVPRRRASGGSAVPVGSLPSSPGAPRQPPARLEYPDFRVVPGKSGYDTPGMRPVLALLFTSA
ncbi:hypothetical protein GCM10009769_24680 [Curtobacterium luteum]|uniref:Uncharacterized protein n=1 Tax=Curtobacterium luteum TaxID=33881 RepID=A0A8H9GCY4_9MICO|nr:hypothetical protein GCM10009769_24680 [Curtobacterium luteum]